MLLMGIGAWIWRTTAKSSWKRKMPRAKFHRREHPPMAPEDRDDAAEMLTTEIEARESDWRRKGAEIRKITTRMRLVRVVESTKKLDTVASLF